MSRIAKLPINLPKGVTANIAAQEIAVKGAKGELKQALHMLVNVEQKEDQLLVTAKDDSIEAKALSGTTRALVANMVHGVTEGFTKKLALVGVGYRAQLQGNKLNLALGFSHPVVYDLPEGVSAQVPSQTEIVLTGANKQSVGQAAAEIRRFRPPEPYKGKGVRYADEQISLKEAKKK